MRTLSTSEKVTAGFGFVVVLLGLIIGGVYVYGWKVNPDWGTSQQRKMNQWRMDRLSAELSAVNMVKISLRESITFKSDGRFPPFPFFTCDKFAGWRLVNLRLNNHGGIKDIAPLAGWPLIRLDLSSTGVTELSPLAGMPLRELNLNQTPVADIRPLRGMTLTGLEIESTDVCDLSPLKGMPLQRLVLSGTKVRDLSPLRGMPLTELVLDFTDVADLSPLAGMPLKFLDITGTPVTDLSPLKGMPLERLFCEGIFATDWSVVEGMKIADFRRPSAKKSGDELEQMKNEMRGRQEAMKLTLRQLRLERDTLLSTQPAIIR